MGHVFAFLTKYTWPWAPTPQAIILPENFFGNQAIISVFGVLDWFACFIWSQNYGSKTPFLTKI